MLRVGREKGRKGRGIGGSVKARSSLRKLHSGTASEAESGISWGERGELILKIMKSEKASNGEGGGKRSAGKKWGRQILDTLVFHS